MKGVYPLDNNYYVKYWGLLVYAILVAYLVSS